MTYDTVGQIPAAFDLIQNWDDVLHILEMIGEGESFTYLFVTINEGSVDTVYGCFSLSLDAPVIKLAGV